MPDPIEPTRREAWVGSVLLFAGLAAMGVTWSLKRVPWILGVVLGLFALSGLAFNLWLARRRGQSLWSVLRENARPRKTRG